MAVLGSLNQSKRIVGPGQVYLVAYPAGGYTGGTDALRVTNLKSQFFSDSATDALRSVTPSVYSDISATGIEVKIKQNSVEFDPNMGSKYKLANSVSEATITWEYKDLDANKLIDAFSAITGDTFTTAAASSVAGRKSVLLGRQSAPLTVAILVRYPSEIISAGGVPEYRNIIAPMANITPDWTLKIDKKGATVCKVVATCIGDMSLIGTMPMPPILLTDDVTAAGT